MRRWSAEALDYLDLEARAVPRVPLHRVPLPPQWDIALHVHDESAQPTGSVNHRLIRGHFREAVESGRINEDTTVVTATGSTAAVAAAYFARLLDLPFIAVVPERTSAERIAEIETHGGKCVRWGPAVTLQDEGRRIAAENDGHFLDHFVGTDLALAHEADTLASDLFANLAETDHPVPDWIVVGASTGATSSVLGRHLRHQGYPTKLAVVDPENSAYFPGWISGAADYTTGTATRIDGVGRPRVEPGFHFRLVDLLIPVPDAASIAAMRHLRACTGLESGPSTGTHLWGVWELVSVMRRDGLTGSVATVLADGAEHHRHTYWNDAWVTRQGWHPDPYLATIEGFLASGEWVPPDGR